MTKKGLFLSILLLLAASCAVPPVGSAQSDPSGAAASKTADDWRPQQIEIVMPHAVGSNQDITTRILGEKWSALLGIPFVYNNKEGASGQVGYTYFMTLPKDGAALLSTNLASASIMYRQQQPDFSWEDDLEWMGLFGIDPGTFFVPKDSPFASIQDVIDAAKRQTVTIAISYWASPDNLLLQQVMQQTGAKFEIIPYGSGNDLVTQVLGGHVQLGLTKVSGVEKAGDALRHLAITMDENPVPGITNDAPPLDAALGTDTLVLASYRAINMPKQLRKDYPGRFQKIKDAFEAAKDDPDVIEGMRKAGVDPSLIVDWTPEQLNEQTQVYWDVFEKYKDIYLQAK